MLVFFQPDIYRGLTEREKVDSLVGVMILAVWELFGRVESFVLLVAAHLVGVVLWTVRWWIDRMWDRRRGRGGDDDDKEGDAAEDDSCEMHLEVKVKCR
jgi:hypothetical protein